MLVPLNTLYRPRELGHALAHAEVSLLIAARGFLRHDYAASLAELGIVPDRGAVPAAAFPALRDVVLLDPAAPLDLAPLARAIRRPGRRARTPTMPATIVFTSGSTAAPKGVVHTHAALCLAAEGDATVLGIEPDDRTWGYLPFFFAGGLVAVALATLSRGAAVVLQDVFEPGETLRLLAARAGQRVLRLAAPGGGPDRAPALRGDAALAPQGRRREHEVGRRALRRRIIMPSARTA